MLVVGEFGWALASGAAAPGGAALKGVATGPGGSTGAATGAVGGTGLLPRPSCLFASIICCACCRRSGAGTGA